MQRRDAANRFRRLLRARLGTAYTNARRYKKRDELSARDKGHFAPRRAGDNESIIAEIVAERSNRSRLLSIRLTKTLTRRIFFHLPKLSHI